MTRLLLLFCLKRWLPVRTEPVALCSAHRLAKLLLMALYRCLKGCPTLGSGADRIRAVEDIGCLGIALIAAIEAYGGHAVPVALAMAARAVAIGPACSINPSSSAATS